MRALKYTSTIVLCAFAFPLLADTQSLSCTSSNSEYHLCRLSNADLRDIRIQSVQSGDCMASNAWGVQKEGIWVKGCSATFEYTPPASEATSSSDSNDGYYGDSLTVVPYFEPYYGPGYYYGAGYYEANGWNNSPYYCTGHSCAEYQDHNNPNPTQEDLNNTRDMNSHADEQIHNEYNSDEHGYEGFQGGPGGFEAGGPHGGGGGGRR